MESVRCSHSKIIARIMQAIMRWIYPGLKRRICDMFYVSIQINQDEAIFFQVGQYVAQQEESMRNKRLTHVQGVTKNDDRAFMFFQHFEEIPVPRPQISILPSKYWNNSAKETIIFCCYCSKESGTTQTVWHKGRKVWVTRMKVPSEDASASNLNSLNLGDLSSLLNRSQEIMEIRFVIREKKHMDKIN